MIDAGGPPLSGIPAYNGGLFAKGPVDDLELDDDRYTGFFNTLGTYDFADEVNLDVLGHLFERSITEVEKLKETGFFGGDAEKAQAFARMPQSAKRKRLGIYYTPPELTSRIVQYTVEELIDERFAAVGGDPESIETAYARLEVLRKLKIVDPACGSGAFLFQAYDTLELRYAEVLARLPEPEHRTAAAQVPHFILTDNLYGVDLSPEAVKSPNWLCGFAPRTERRNSLACRTTLPMATPSSPTRPSTPTPSTGIPASPKSSTAKKPGSTASSGTRRGSGWICRSENSFLCPLLQSRLQRQVRNGETL